MKKFLFFVDAETDGLYGEFISVAVVVTDRRCNEMERFYFGIDKSRLVIHEQWVRDNVIPILGDYELCNDEDELLEKIWGIWKKYKDASFAIGDVIYPVESRMFQKCIEIDSSRIFDAPFPFLDLSSILYAKGVDPLISRTMLIGEEKNNLQHNALYDVEMSIKIYKKYVLEEF